jgi:hypothetical protein
MFVTFQIQVLASVEASKQEFTERELQLMKSDMEDFKTKLERFAYVRAQMYVDGVAVGGVPTPTQGIAK